LYTLHMYSYFYINYSSINLKNKTTQKWRTCCIWKILTFLQQMGRTNLYLRGHNLSFTSILLSLVTSVPSLWTFISETNTVALLSLLSDTHFCINPCGSSPLFKSLSKLPLLYLFWADSMHYPFCLNIILHRNFQTHNIIFHTDT
jgi:hypothetical protein